LTFLSSKVPEAAAGADSLGGAAKEVAPVARSANRISFRSASSE